jgi:uncharacterized membrane protein YhiD involved in acid resistance
VVTIIALVILRKIEKRIKILIYKTITVSADITENVEESITSLLTDSGIRIHSVDYSRNALKDSIALNFSVSTRDSQAFKNVFLKIAALDFIRSVRVDSRETYSTNLLSVKS